MLFAFAFSSCQEPILYNINKEVKLEEATILGDIYGVIRSTDSTGKEVLYIANGNIYCKDADDKSHGSWKKVDSPAGHVQFLGADSSNLYAFVWTFDNDSGNGETHLNTRKIYYTNKNNINWQEISTTLIGNSSHTQKVRLMCTNSPNNAHRHAFIRIDSTIYKLNGASALTQVTTGDINSCVWWKDGTVKFFKSYGSCSDETKNSGPSIIYFGKGNVVRATSDGTEANSTSVSSGVRGQVLSIAVMKNENKTDDVLLIGSSAGAALIDGTSGDEIEFSNLTSTVSNLYENHAALAVYPEKSYKDNTIYASNQVYGTGSNSAQFSHEGLWSYYPARGKWNIE